MSPDQLLHPCLESVDGAAPATAPLTDCGRVAVVLEAAALLSHLQRGRWRLRDSWRSAVIDGDGRLRSVTVRPGRPEAPPQVHLRRLLLALFRGRDSVAGRGEARRVAQRLAAAWRQELVPVAADHAVVQMLELAGFLWQAPFAGARRALGGEHRSNGSAELWIAGPSQFRARILAATRTLDDVWSLLGSPQARRLWLGPAKPDDALTLVAAGRPRAALAAWRLHPPRTPDARLEHGRALIGTGRFEQARRTLRGLRGPEARVLRVRCLTGLGEMAAARRRLARLEAERLAPPVRLAAAAAAVELFRRLGQPERARDWVQRALGVSAAGLRLEATVLAAEAARDRGDGAALVRHLEQARSARQRSDLAWRWHWARGRLALLQGEARAAAGDLRSALGYRRRISDRAAADVWRDLGRTRVLAGDLAGAERALLHVLRLLERSEDRHRQEALLLSLAEVRLRRGRPGGVCGLLKSGGRRLATGAGRVRRLALEARHELFLGRPGRALGAVERARDGLVGAAGERWRGRLGMLAARALGWLGRPAEALAELAALGPESPPSLEPEELPALWALAGDRGRALAVARGELAGVWRAVLAGRSPDSRLWRALDRIETYRAARLVYDVERVAPGATSPARLRWSAGRLRGRGAESLADHLERCHEGGWSALAGYLNAGGDPRQRLIELFAAARHARPRLTWRRRGRETVLVDGAGGRETLEAPLHGGRLILAAERVDAMVESFFTLACRDLPPPPRVASWPGGIVGDSILLRRCLDRLARLAAADLPVLIHGETGTGKELAARWVHERSRRRGRPLLPVNCAALSDELLLSELFGHVRGAFTGADRDRAGIFEAAAGGTVFLDEIGDLPLTAQGKLLRVLQEGEVRRVGESVARRIEVRVLAATHRDLGRMVADGGFREDLYYRLRGGRALLPPLRRRRSDILLLADWFLRRSGGPVLRLTSAARERLRRYDWPGNVRELKNVLEAAAALAEGGLIRSEQLDLPGPESPAAPGYHEQVLEFRHRLVEEALTACGGNRAAAARRLGLSRQALSYLVRRLELA